MYDTSLGIRVLYDAEAQLFASAAWTLTDQLRNLIPAGDAPAPELLLGNPVLDSLTAPQVIVLIDRVSSYLLDPYTAAPTRTSVLDATIAAVFQQISTDVQAEIDVQSLSAEAEEGDTSLRTKVAAASLQTSESPSSAMDTPHPECAVMETWQLVIERLCDRILPDSDWQLESVMLDLDPRKSAELKGAMGIQDDYFIDVVAEASVDDAALAWCNLVERLTGWRPEMWRFNGPIPADAVMPPAHDILSFPEPPLALGGAFDAHGDTPGFQQIKPALLSDILFEIDSSSDDWSSYLNRKTGEVVGLPTSLISMIENGDDPNDYLCDGIEFLEVAQKICNSNDFLPLPSQYEIHEWSIMREFCNSVDNDSDRRELLEAVHGSGAFRFFRKTADRLGLTEQWYAYKQAAIEQKIIDWLEAHSVQWSRAEPGEPPF